MGTERIAKKSVGEIVASNFSVAKLFEEYGIDYCCHGEIELDVACAEKGLPMDEVIKAIKAKEQQESIPFAQWPSDLLIDYVLKIHHRNIRSKGAPLLELMEKVMSVHGDKYHNLTQVHSLFVESLEDLEMHLVKEEQVLFPYCLELFEANDRGEILEPMHCGTVLNPIGVMRMEHEAEGNRYAMIGKLTNNYTVSDEACVSYKLLMNDLKLFMTALHEHIHIENNILFPNFVEMEKKVVNFSEGGVCGY